jgi:nucleotide-binding universal stress UspA family protein
MNIAKILCAVDFSECSRQALEYATYLAETFDSELHVVHAYWDVPPYVAVDPRTLYPGTAHPKEDPVRNAAGERLQQLLDSMKAPWNTQIRSHMVLGHPADAVHDLARELTASLVVTGTHGRGGLKRMLLGSVAERVLRDAAFPVVTVRERAMPHRQVKRILTAVDFSEASLAAAHYAINLGERFNPVIEVLHVAAIPLELSAVAIEPSPAAPPIPLPELALRRAKEAMANFVATLQGDMERLMKHQHFLEIQHRVEAGAVAARIVERAKEADHDVIVMGTHGRTGIARLFLGSTAAQVTRMAECPVFVVPQTNTP